MRSSTRHGGAPPTSAAHAPHGTSPFPATRVSQSRSAEDLSGARGSPSAAPRAPRAPPGGRLDGRVADVLVDDAGAHVGDLRPLREMHIHSRRSSPSAASNRSSPSGAAPAATQATRWSPRSAVRGYLSGPQSVTSVDADAPAAAHRPDRRAAVATGGCAEYPCVPDDLLELKPANLTFEQAAAVPLAALTAPQALRDKGNVQPGQKVLINGASGEAWARSPCRSRSGPALR